MLLRLRGGRLGGFLGLYDICRYRQKRKSEEREQKELVWNGMPFYLRLTAMKRDLKLPAINTLVLQK